MKNIKKKKVLEVLAKNRGIIVSACKAVDISRHAFYDWLKKDPEFKKKYEEILEEAVDAVESKLYDKIEKQEDTTAIIFYLKCKGKNRGYVDKQIVESTVKFAKDESLKDALKRIKSLNDNQE